MIGYYVPGARRISRGQRRTLLDRFRLWRRRRKVDDLWFMRM